MALYFGEVTYRSEK
ncbi:hypothetical protein RDI58_008892 [Solanum bulbocastanum]|uniref:Uncharacterized protein n=1 Tax=Solanum bulbocastanum TaxID=147425 RepID=A0AAN8TZ57_SOLBU